MESFFSDMRPLRMGDALKLAFDINNVRKKTFHHETVPLCHCRLQLGNNINGVAVNYKVYITTDVNAWAMTNDCVRVYSRMMGMMNDDEVRGVAGHEMGYVALGHTKKAMQDAYATTSVRSVASAAGGMGRALSGSQLSDFSES